MAGIEDDEDTGWHNRPPVLWAAGAAAVALVALLVFAVIRMSQGPTTTPPQPGEPLPSYATSRTSSEAATTTTTSYPVPSAQTSEDSPGAVTTGGTPPPQDALDPDTSTPTSTSIFNPYVTTTQPAAGHV
ncbi:MAG: hypothetical protein ABWY93_20020 [Mycobacterium sp.]